MSLKRVQTVLIELLGAVAEIVWSPEQC